MADPCPTCGGACRTHAVIHLACNALVALLGSSLTGKTAWCGVKVPPLEAASESLIPHVTCRACLIAFAAHHTHHAAAAASRLAALDALLGDVAKE
jgi:hypothetical protein